MLVMSEPGFDPAPELARDAEPGLAWEPAGR